MFDLEIFSFEMFVLNVIHILKLHLLINFNQSFHKHLLGRRHARTILEKQGKELDVEEFKNFSMVSEEVLLKIDFVVCLTIVPGGKVVWRLGNSKDRCVHVLF